MNTKRKTARDLISPDPQNKNLIR